MVTKVRIERQRYGAAQVGIFETEAFNMEGRLAIAMLERWGPVVGTMDGEDSAGRSRMRDASPEETVTRAFDVARAAIRIARERGLMVDVPDLNEINAAFDAKFVAEAQEI